MPGLIVAWLITTWSACAEMRTTGGPEAAVAGRRERAPSIAMASAAALAMILFFM